MRLLKFVLFYLCFSVFADGSAYSKNVSIFARTENLFFLHEHKFDFETDSGNYSVTSYVELIDITAGKSIFKKSSPYYSNVFALEDGKFFLALSNIKAGSNPQIVIYSKAGDIVAEKSFRCSDLVVKDSCVESISNYIEWYSERWPYVKSDISDDFLIVKVDEHLFRFPLNTK